MVVVGAMLDQRLRRSTSADNWIRRMKQSALARPSTALLCTISFLIAGSALYACSSAGPYGHARSYSPLGAEADAAQGAVDYDPVMANRLPHEWAGKRVSVFGTIDSVKPGGAGSSDVSIAIRTLQGRNLCATEASSSCRVTVSEHSFGTVHVMLDPKQVAPEGRLAPGALLRVIGEVHGDAHPETGNTVILGGFARIWPPQQFVTTKDREYMLR